jgi:hypothetical protein
VFSWISPRGDLDRLSDRELARRLEDAFQALDASSSRWPWHLVHWTAYLAVREIEDVLEEIKRRIDATGAHPRPPSGKSAGR